MTYSDTITKEQYGKFREALLIFLEEHFVHEELRTKLLNATCFSESAYLVSKLSILTLNLKIDKAYMEWCEIQDMHENKEALMSEGKELKIKLKTLLHEVCNER